MTSYQLPLGDGRHIRQNYTRYAGVLSIVGWSGDLSLDRITSQSVSFFSSLQELLLCIAAYTSFISATMYTHSSINAPPPPYTPLAHSGRPSAKPCIANLPLHIVHRILIFTLDQKATPSKFWSDPEEERVRRLWGMFRGLRGVNRVFWLGKFEGDLAQLILDGSSYILTPYHQWPPQY